MSDVVTPKWGVVKSMAEHNTAMRERQGERSAWLDPRFWVQIAVLIIGLTGSWITTSIVSERRATNLEGVGQQLKDSVAKMEINQAQIAGLVQQMTTTVVRLQTEREADRREIEDLKRAKELHDTWIVTITNRISKLEAKSDK